MRYAKCLVCDTRQPWTRRSERGPANASAVGIIYHRDPDGVLCPCRTGQPVRLTAV